MHASRSAFRFFALSSCLFGVLLIFVFGFHRFGEGSAHPFLRQGILLMLLLGIWLAVNLFAALESRLRPLARLGSMPKAAVLEGVAAAALLMVGTVLRVLALRMFPMEPASDFRTFYEIGELLARDALTAEGPGYCDYIAMFPHVYGYASVLGGLFRLTGPSVFAGQILNLVFSLGTCFAAYRAARIAAGRLAGLTALALLTLWPSLILYGTMLGSEPLSAFLLMLSFWLYVWLARSTMANTHSLAALLLYLLLGALLAAAASVRPTGLLLLVALLLALLRGKAALPAAPLVDIPVTKRFLAAGWRRGAVIALAYLCTSGILAARVPFTIEREPAGGISGLGYNLLVGVNSSSEGGWNEEDSRYLYDALTVTGSAEAAQKACLDAALQRLRSTPPAALGELFLRKFSALWSNDDYGATWNSLFLAQQNDLTEARASMLHSLIPVGNAYYMAVVLLSSIAVLLLLHGGRGITGAYPLVLLFLGTVVLHLLVENQNRYHYHLLPALAVLGGIGVAALVGQHRRLQKRSHKQLQLARAAERKRLASVRMEELARERAEALRTEALREVFDLDAALRDGHVRIVASEAYLTDCQKGEHGHEET